MVIVNLYSKRQKVLRKEAPDVYEYDQIPKALRVQIVHILRDLFGYREPHDITGCLKSFAAIKDTLCREYGVFSLNRRIGDSVDDEVINFVLTAADHERVLDVVEYSFGVYRWLIRNDAQRRRGPKALDNAIVELNARFREH